MVTTFQPLKCPTFGICPVPEQCLLGCSREQPAAGGLHRLAGMPIIISDRALQDTTERLFPASKNRSRRIHKKLVKRYGGEFQKKPVAFRMGDSFIIHPAVYETLKHELERRAA